MSFSSESSLHINVNIHILFVTISLLIIKNQVNNINKELISKFGGHILNSIIIDILGNFLLC